MKYKILINTAFHKKVKRIDDKFGVVIIHGKQGSGKGYFACQYILLQDLTKCNYIKTNVHSLKNMGKEIRYFNKLDEIVHDDDEYCIYLIDELSRKYKKNSTCDSDFYAWLNQSRKKKRIVILITQEWRELPMWLRRPAKYVIGTKPTPILNLFGWYTSIVGDGENLQYNEVENEYIAPDIKIYIYRRIKNIADKYDTFESIHEL